MLWCVQAADGRATGSSSSSSWRDEGADSGSSLCVCDRRDTLRVNAKPGCSSVSTSAVRESVGRSHVSVAAFAEQTRSDQKGELKR